MGIKSRFLAVLTALVLAAVPVRAEPLKPLPELSPQFDLAGYAAQTASVTRAYERLPHVAYEISLPKNWVERTTLGQDFGELTRFDGPVVREVRPYFSFKRVQMNRENSARNEIIAYMLKSGYVLRGFKEIDDRNVEALYVVQDATGDSFAVRTIARVQGPALLLAEYAVPITNWEKGKDEQTFAIQSFKFTRDSDEPVEKRIKRVYHNSLSMNYPASWVFEGETALAENQAMLVLSNPGMGQVKNGEIRIGLYSGRSLISPETNLNVYPVDVPELLKSLKARYHDQKYDFDATIEQKKPDLSLPVKFSMMEVYNLRERKTEYDTQTKEPVTKELWVALFQTNEPTPRTIIVELLTPARTQDIYLWSVNTRAFDIILKSIQ